MKRKMLLFEAMPRVHSYLLSRSALEMRIAGAQSSVDLDGITILFNKNGGPLVSYSTIDNLVSFNLSKATSSVNLDRLESRYGDIIVNEIVKELRVAAKFNWADKPKKKHIKDAAKFARRYGVPTDTFKQTPEVVWVRPTESMTLMKPVEWIYSKRMPAQDNIHIVRDDKTDTIEKHRVEKVSKHDPISPVIVVQAPSGAWMVADGNHRVHLATSNNQPFRACIYYSDREWVKNE